MVLVIADLMYYPFILSIYIIRQNLCVNHTVSSGTGEVLSINDFMYHPDSY